MSLYEQQARNRRLTWVAMGAFIALLLLLGAGFDGLNYAAEGALVPFGSAIALLYGGGSAAHAYFRGDRSVIASTRATPLAEARRAHPDAIKYRQLQNTVEEMAIAAGLPPPAVYVIGDQDPNALAAGLHPEHAAIAVTEGLLDTLNRDQLQAVVAHEMSHIRNFDVRLMTVVAALVGAIALLADFAERGWRGGALGARRSGRSREARNGGGATAMLLLVIWLVAIVLAPIVARVLAMTVSRRREFLADASAAELTRNPGALADALEVIEARVEPTKAIHRGSAQLCIADPLGRPVNERHGRWADLLATHPPMHERIAALRAMAYR